MLRNVQRERGFAHRRTAGNDDQFRLMETEQHLIQFAETGLEAGDAALALRSLFHVVNDLQHDLTDRLVGAVFAFFQKIENSPLRLLQ